MYIRRRVGYGFEKDLYVLLCNIYVRSIKTSIKLKYGKTTKTQGGEYLFFPYKKQFSEPSDSRACWFLLLSSSLVEEGSNWKYGNDIVLNNSVKQQHTQNTSDIPIPTISPSLLNAQNNNKLKYGTKYCTWQVGICYLYKWKIVV